MPMGRLVRRFDFRVSCTDSRAIDLFEINLPAANAEQFQLLNQRRRFDAGSNQSAQNHVAAGAGKTIEVKGLHRIDVFSAVGTAYL